MGLTAATSITMGGVTVWDEGTHETFARDKNGTSMVRRLRCAWSARKTLVAHLRSGSQQIGTVTIITGAQEYPDYAGVYVDTIGIDGEGVMGTAGAGGMVSYEWAVLSVRYAPIDFTVGQTELDFGKEIISLPANGELVQYEGGGIVPIGVAFPVTIVSLRQSRYNLPSLPIAKILTATEKPINSSAIFGAPAGTILFDGGRSLMRYVIGQPYQYDITYAFLYKPMGWNKILDNTGTWRNLQRRNGTPLVESSDLNALFT